MKRVTLTFDNGPHEHGTTKVLEVLARRELNATIFLVGGKLLIPTLAKLAADIQSHGHRIANNTMAHSVALGREAGRYTAVSGIACRKTGSAPKVRGSGVRTT